MADRNDQYRQDHEKMRVAAELPISGPAASDTLAASGGLELPGREPSPEPVQELQSEPSIDEPIPGEHDHGAEMDFQPGGGSAGFGSDLPQEDRDPTLDATTARERAWEGGGLIKGQRAKTRSRSEFRSRSRSGSRCFVHRWVMADKKRTVSGPGASDFVSAPGGEDIPGVSPSKGTSELREDADLTDAKNLVPELEPDQDPPKHERTRLVPDDRKPDEKAGT